MGPGRCGSGPPLLFERGQVQVLLDPVEAGVVLADQHAMPNHGGVIRSDLLAQRCDLRGKIVRARGCRDDGCPPSIPAAPPPAPAASRDASRSGHSARPALGPDQPHSRRSYAVPFGVRPPDHLVSLQSRSSGTAAPPHSCRSRVNRPGRGAVKAGGPRRSPAGGEWSGRAPPVPRDARAWSSPRCRPSHSRGSARRGGP
jgi:hypothetical protein